MIEKFSIYFCFFFHCNLTQNIVQFTHCTNTDNRNLSLAPKDQMSQCRNSSRNSVAEYRRSCSRHNGPKTQKSNILIVKQMCFHIRHWTQTFLLFQNSTFFPFTFTARLLRERKETKGNLMNKECKRLRLWHFTTVSKTKID